MKERNRKALTYSVLGMASVLVTAFLTDILAPQSPLGEGLRFSVPLLTGIIAGAIIFLRLKEDLDYKVEDVENPEE